MATGVPILYNGPDATHNSYGTFTLVDGYVVIQADTDIAASGALFITGIGSNSAMGQLYVSAASADSIEIQSTVGTGNNNSGTFLLLNSTSDGAPGAGPVSLMYLMGSGNNINVGTGTLSGGVLDIPVPGHNSGDLAIVCRTQIRSANNGNLTGLVVELSGETTLVVRSSNLADDSSFSYLIIPHPVSTIFSGVTAKIPPLVRTGPTATYGSARLVAGDVSFTSTAISESTILFFFIFDKTAGSISVDEYVYEVVKTSGYVEIQSNVPTSTSLIYWFAVNL